MADRETWAKRVAEWKASGLSSPAFCAGKDFTAGGLRHWAHRLTHGEQRRPRVRLAKVVRLSKPPAPPTGSGTSSDLVVEIGAARVAVRPGCDRATLAAVLEELMAVAERAAR
jgi:transposase